MLSLGHIPISDLVITDSFMYSSSGMAMPYIYQWHFCMRLLIYALCA